jgi:hypothetical protein
MAMAARRWFTEAAYADAASQSGAADVVDAADGR